MYPTQTAAKAETGRAQINRANAQHSTGPQTLEGKRRSSLNAVRHGLTGLTVVLPSDDLDAYRHFVRAFDAELNPQGLLEQAAAQTIADTHWRLNRIRVLENNLFANSFVEFSPAIATEDAPVRAALAQAKALEVHADVLNKLSLYEQRLNRTLEKATAELTRLQQQRQWRERKHKQDPPPPPQPAPQPNTRLEKTNPAPAPETAPPISSGASGPRAAADSSPSPARAATSSPGSTRSEP